MKNSTLPVRASTRRQARSAGWLGLVMLAAWPLGSTALAANGLDAGAARIAVDTSVKLADRGWFVRQAVTRHLTSGWFEPRSASFAADAHGGAVDGALSRLDAGHDGAFRFSAATALGDERLLLRSRLHLTRPSAGLHLSPANRFRAFPELALTWRLTHELAIGAEYRLRPDNRNPAGPFGTQTRDGNWKDVFLAWSPSSHFSLTASYVDLGRLAPTLGGGRRTGHYVAAEFWY